MFARLITKIIMVAIAVAMVFFGVGLLGWALATVLVKNFGVIEGSALSGAILFVLPLIWVIIVRLRRPKRAPAPSGSELIKMLLAALAKDISWITVVGAALASATSALRKRHQDSK